MLPDGSYRMSQTQAAECIELKVQNISDFFRSKAFKSVIGEDYTPQIFEIEPDVEQIRGGSRIEHCHLRLSLRTLCLSIKPISQNIRLF